MTANHDLERRLADLYADEAPPRAPVWVLDQALATIDTTPQRRARLRGPWRFLTMSSYAKLATAAVVVVAAGAIGLVVLRPGSSGPGGPTTPSPVPSASPSAGGPAASAPPPLTATFTSDIHGISIGYPEGWSIDPAAGPGSVVPWNFRDPGGDTIYDPRLEDHLFLHLRSEPIGSMSAEAWIADRETFVGCPSTEPITIDGATGTIGVDGCNGILVVKDGRGYGINQYGSPDDAWLPDVYDRAWFMDVLDTVRLDPASAAPPMPAADARYESTMFGLSIAYPSAWTVTPGTGLWTSGVPLEAADTIQRGSDNVFLRIASQPLNGMTGETWAGMITRSNEWGDTCGVNTDEITIDGSVGQFILHCPSDVFNGLAWTADRGYLIIGYEIGDIAWFKDVLESVQLIPEDAVDTAPSASP